MNMFARLSLQHKLGVMSRDHFDVRLVTLLRCLWHKQEISPAEREVIERPDVLAYIQTIRRKWFAIATQGAGKMTLGFFTRADAIRELGRIIPKSAVINIDDTNAFIFYKLQE